MNDKRTFNCPKCGYAFKQGDNGKCKRCEEKEAFEKATGTDHESYMKANQQKREAEAREDKGSSTQTKLKVIVEKMVERWEPGEEMLKKAYKEKLGDYIIEVDDGVINIKICTAQYIETNRYNEEFSNPIYTELFSGSLPDLLCNSAAMGALFGRERICEICGASMNSKRGLCNEWGHENIKGQRAHLYHTLEAVKRIYDKSAGIEAAIDYLYREEVIG
jgi:uncharacterized FlaG/YvyC family protein